MVIRSEVHSWLWAMEGTCCLSRPMCENQLEKKLAKQLLFVCLRELPSKRNRWERSQRRYWQEAADSILKAKKSSIESERGLATDSPARKRNGRRWALTSGPHRRAATYVDQYSGGETVRLVCASEYRKLECAAIAAAFETVWIARLVFLRSCAGGCVLTVDFAPLAPSLFAILRAGDRPRLAAYSLPSIDATCGGSRSRYGRPTPSSVSWARRCV